MGIASHNVGHSTLAQLGGDTSEGVATVYHAITLQRKLEKLLSRLPTP